MEMETLADYANYVGHHFDPSPWLMIDQKMIDDFGAVTKDLNWYHVDIERARRELPGGRTIAHGLLTLSLVPALAAQIASVRHHGRAFNYGFDRVRYPHPYQSIRASGCICRSSAPKERRAGCSSARATPWSWKGGPSLFCRPK